MSDDELELDDEALQAAAGGSIGMYNSPTQVPGHDQYNTTYNASITLHP